MNVSEINAALDARHDEMTAEELTYLVQSNFSGSLLSLRQLKPFIEEIKRRFKHLPRKIGVDGQYRTIAGHRNFKSWCAGVLNRTDRAVRFMLAKAREDEKKPEDKKKPKDKTEDVSVLLGRVESCLFRNISKVQDKHGTKESLLFIETIINILERERERHKSVKAIA